RGNRPRQAIESSSQRRQTERVIPEGSRVARVARTNRPGPANQRGERPCGTPSPEARVDERMERAVAVWRKLPAIHRVEIVGVDPVLFVAELRLDALEKRRARQRIRDRYADVIRLAAAHHRERLLDVGARLSRIAELQEETHADPRSAEKPRR